MPIPLCVFNKLVSGRLNCFQILDILNTADILNTDMMSHIRHCVYTYVDFCFSLVAS